MQTPIRFENVSKAYLLGENRGSLREAITQIGKKIFSKPSDSKKQVYWALRNVSCEVEKGEVLGLIGPNGAGKTTSLKLLSRITYPTSGKITVKGRVSALIELGAGFHPDLTGRENIYLNASILGLHLKEVDQKFDQIVAFSGLEKFLDTPVKRYSSGMYVRLGFSIAAHFEPDVLLVDEVLSVGDAQFRQRCTQRFIELRRLGTTIVFVSHNLYLVESVCDRGIFLLNGQIESHGKIGKVINAYEAWLRETQIKEIYERSLDISDPTSSSTISITQVDVRNPGSLQSDEFHSDDALEIRVYYDAHEPIRKPNVYIKIIQATGTTCCMIRTGDFGYELDDFVGKGTVSIIIDPIQLSPGAYVIDAELLGSLEGVALAERHSQWFQISGSTVGREGVFVPSVSMVKVETNLEKNG